jgi:hypothetical protein
MSPEPVWPQAFAVVVHEAPRFTGNAGAETLQVPSHWMTPAFILPQEFAGLQESPRFAGFAGAETVHVPSQFTVPVFVDPQLFDLEHAAPLFETHVGGGGGTQVHVSPSLQKASLKQFVVAPR